MSRVRREPAPAPSGPPRPLSLAAARRLALAPGASAAIPVAVPSPVEAAGLYLISLLPDAYARGLALLGPTVVEGEQLAAGTISLHVALLGDEPVGWSEGDLLARADRLPGPVAAPPAGISPESSLADGILLYTDGACRGNPGPAAWAYAVVDPETGEGLAEGAGLLPETSTNNRAELTAALEGLRAVPQGVRVVVHTDSEYLKNGITRWIAGWRRNGWRTQSGEPVKNRDLWEELLDEVGCRRIDWRWVKGHAGDRWNERVDRLANEVLDGKRGGARQAPRP